jgi:sugar phosphate isomerase/epimerase
MVDNLSITTIYGKVSTGSPEPYLRKIAEEGFSHVHWSHHWNTDFMYSRSEIEQIRDWLKVYRLQALNMHGSAGVEKKWDSKKEYERIAGVELVANRIEMAGALGADVVIMHFERQAPHPEVDDLYWERLRRSFDTLEPIARKSGVRIALENFEDDSFKEVKTLFAAYSPDYLGFCYDSGHGNMGRAEGLDHLEEVKERLIAVHLHDNNGAMNDQHRVPFCGTIDWPRLAGIIRRSGYRNMINLEATMDYPDFKSQDAFLKAAFAAGNRLKEMVIG